MSNAQELTYGHQNMVTPLKTPYVLKVPGAGGRGGGAHSEQFQARCTQEPLRNHELQFS
jgi:hypothetical protein